jgi:hypothetical protein
MLPNWSGRTELKSDYGTIHFSKALLRRYPRTHRAHSKKLVQRQRRSQELEGTNSAGVVKLAWLSLAASPHGDATSGDLINNHKQLNFRVWGSRERDRIFREPGDVRHTEPGHPPSVNFDSKKTKVRSATSFATTEDAPSAGALLSGA